MTACPTCERFYGDSAPCDESKPVCSPHRKADGSPGPWPTLVIHVAGSFACESYCWLGCKAETKRMKAAAKASKHAVWPPVPKGRKGLPKSHLKPPKPDDPSPVAWVNAALHGSRHACAGPWTIPARFLNEYADWRVAQGFAPYSVEPDEESAE